MSDMARRLRMTPEDAAHDAVCEHFREAVGLAMTVMQQDERIERLEAVVTEARNVLEAFDQADPMADWTGAMVDTRLRSAVAALDREGGRP